MFPVEKLRELIHLKPGQTANALQADQDAGALKSLYGSRGYMGVQIHPATETNDADSTVKYVFEIKEGSIYKMGDLEVRGLDSKATERIGAAWKLLPGQTYNSEYPGAIPRNRLPKPFLRTNGKSPSTKLPRTRTK